MCAQHRRSFGRHRRAPNCRTAAVLRRTMLTSRRPKKVYELVIVVYPHASAPRLLTPVIGVWFYVKLKYCFTPKQYFIVCPFTPESNRKMAGKVERP
jgi:hypothetical protein